jgi:hypothetical protein
MITVHAAVRTGLVPIVVKVTVYVPVGGFNNAVPLVVVVL